jgi:alkyldihydroxyacetonephosphate synthase
VREAARAELPVAMMRLSDAAETELSLLLRHDPARRFDPTATGLSLAERFGYGAGRCVLLYGAENSDARKVATTMRRARNGFVRNGGLPLGRSPGRAWRRERFRTPYLRDWLLDHGVAVDTMETALPWARLEAGHGAVVQALRSAAATHAGAGLAMAHLSHSYLDGACLYFTVLYPVEAGRDVEQWRAIKRDATEAILAAGGTLAHDHGVGVDHQPWMARERRARRRGAARREARRRSAGVMNPGSCCEAAWTLSGRRAALSRRARRGGRARGRRRHRRCRRAARRGVAGCARCSSSATTASGTSVVRRDGARRPGAPAQPPHSRAKPVAARPAAARTIS